ncbi:hypothetical protein CC78DRAFT_565446 [Lojkania enalia]|uniref:Uncharacterized protein n=1 Tax=Lojkania enalia TaxID=147567 RepID=A0A9P4N6L9_9PLEO|nr:hypothetical protein CC78DRAFT_565446 [Didymosphaeria enalia]
MEVAAKVVDLTRALLDTVNSESGAQEIVRLVQDWLTREGVDRKEYEYCLSSIGGLAYPNERGLSIRSNIQSADQKMSTISGLKLRISAAIGRWMAFDDNYVYIVTTVATLMAFHGIEDTTEALCNMALDEGGHQNETRMRYSIHRTRLTPVLRKFVESVALHVVNAGSTLKILPPEIQKFYVHKHPLDPSMFSALTMAIQRSDGEMLITCTNFPHDLVSWVLSHFHGYLEISVSGLIVFEEALGRVPKKLLILVKKSCEDESVGSCVISGQDIVEMTTRVGGSFQTLFSDAACHTVARPADRQKLYSTSMLYHCQHRILTQQETAEVHLAAQCMLKWLMDLEVRPHRHSVGFAAWQNGEEEHRRYKRVKIQDLMARYPSFIFENCGQKNSSIIVYRIPDDCSVALQRQAKVEVDVWQGIPYHRAHEDLSQRSWKDIIGCFPIAMSAIQWTKRRCACSSCKREEPLGSGKVGCLREAALDELLLLLSHGIVDSFGLDDTSGLADIESEREALRIIFAELVFQGVVLWNTWFALAALAFLGGKWSTLHSQIGEGWTIFAAIQYGSLVIAAPWLDLTNPINERIFFGASISQGQLCGTSGEHAVVQTERVMEMAEVAGSETFSGGGSRNETVASDDAMLDTAIIGAADIPFRLLTMVRSASYRRIIDPSDALMAVHRAHFPTCSHRKETDEKISRAHYREFTFNHIVGEWSKDHISTDQPANSDRSKKRNITVLLDTNLKYNVALSLAFDGSTVQGEQCCTQCALAFSTTDILPSTIIRTTTRVSTRLIENY